MKYICIAPAKECFNIYNESLGMEGERALYYSGDLNSQRVFRGSYPISSFDNLKIYTCKSKKTAQELCDYINRICNDNFIVKKIGN